MNKYYSLIPVVTSCMLWNYHVSVVEQLHVHYIYVTLKLLLLLITYPIIMID